MKLLAFILSITMIIAIPIVIQATPPCEASYPNVKDFSFAKGFSIDPMYIDNPVFPSYMTFEASEEYKTSNMSIMLNGLVIHEFNISDRTIRPSQDATNAITFTIRGSDVTRNIMGFWSNISEWNGSVLTYNIDGEELARVDVGIHEGQCYPSPQYAGTDMDNMLSVAVFILLSFFSNPIISAAIAIIIIVMVYRKMRK